MRGYATYLPQKKTPYLSQVVIIPESSLLMAPSDIRANIQRQILKYCFPVNFLTPEEALAITGIPPQHGPTTLIWELAGNACSPFLLFEALRRIVPSDTASAFPVTDLRRAWSRKLKLPMRITSRNDFPAPINSALFVQFNGNTKIIRTHECSTIKEALDIAAARYEINKEQYILCSPDETVPVAEGAIAGDWFGARLWLCRIPDTPRS